MTEKEYAVMSEPAVPRFVGEESSGFEPTESPSVDWSLPVYWPRFQVSYLGSLGALRTMSEQVSPDVRMTCDLRCTVNHQAEFAFSLPGVDLADFWRTKYQPSVIYSPWNARSFGSGFLKTVESARKIPQLARYCSVVDSTGKSKPSKKAENRGELDPKTRMIVDLLNGDRAYEPSHTRWAKACWRLDIPEKKRGKVEKGEKEGVAEPINPEIGARGVCGAGGCSGSGDFGSLYLRAAVEHFGPNSDEPGEWVLGGFGWSDGNWWKPLDIVLMLEGAMTLSYPWASNDPFAVATQTPWNKRGPNYGRLWLPIWNGARTWREVQAILISGSQWDGDKRIASNAVDSTCEVKWSQDGQITRMSCDAVVRRVRHRVPVEITIAESPEEDGIWTATVQAVEDGVPVAYRIFDGEHYERDLVCREAMRYVEEAYGDLADVSWKEVTI